MKRFHVHLHVEDLDKSIGFYSKLFAAEPTRVRDEEHSVRVPPDRDRERAAVGGFAPETVAYHPLAVLDLEGSDQAQR